MTMYLMQFLLQNMNLDGANIRSALKILRWHDNFSNNLNHKERTGYLYVAFPYWIKPVQ